MGDPLELDDLNDMEIQIRNQRKEKLFKRVSTLKNIPLNVKTLIITKGRRKSKRLGIYKVVSQFF